MNPRRRRRLRLQKSFPHSISVLVSSPGPGRGLHMEFRRARASLLQICRPETPQVGYPDVSVWARS